jgi:AMP-binding enzyme
MTSNSSSRIGTASPTLDFMLRQNAQRQGDALALIDAPDRPLWADGAPRRMSWNQVDASVSAVAGRFFEMGLPSEAIVCIQGLNLTDTLIALLGCIRAGLVATIVPVDFAPDEIVGLAERLNAKAILSARKMGHDQPLRPLRHLVDESIADIRFIGAFGSDLPGGTVSFEDCIGFPKSGAITRLTRRERPEDSLAIMTVDRGPGGAFVVARNHREWHAAASVLVDELGLSRQSRLLSPMAPSNLSGLAGGLVAWLVSGCQLVLHQAFDATVFAVQMTMHGVTHVLLPDVALQAGLAEGLFSGRKLEKIASLTREPYRSATPAPAPCPVVAFAVLGEVGILPMRLEADGNFTLPGRIDTGSDGQAASVESTIEPGGHLALRGEQVPLVGFDISDRDLSYPVSPEEWVSTGYPAETASGGVRITGIRYGDGANRDSMPTAMSEHEQASSDSMPALAGAA